jgi:hypothetical protein
VYSQSASSASVRFTNLLVSAVTPKAHATSSHSGPVTNAAGTRDYLLGLAPKGTPVDVRGEPAIDEWATSLPWLHFTGSALPATPTSVSGFAFSYSKAKQVQYLAFAVADSSGGCAAGVLTSTDGDRPVVTRSTPLDASGTDSCSADTIAEAAGY